MAKHTDEEVIFNTARKIDSPDAQAEYLSQVCSGDAALRERVEKLLEFQRAESQFMESPALAVTPGLTSLHEQPGTQIGRYKLLQRIGEGGFGVVYMSEQTKPVRRKVALKIIKAGMDTKEVVGRFEAERQALAMMDHPNIAQVYDGGATDNGRPYFVMELVKGVPITEFCDKNQFSTTDRLKLFATVCEAVQHAHHKGIIHRDLKPSNVLVTLADGKPIVKVIDFGVAKATNQQLTEQTLFTTFGQMVGTPQYMSPEQAEMSCLDVDTRSDVYSLGVLLYELLTGTTPLEGERLRTAGYAEMQRIIKEDDPPKPSTRLSTSGEKLTVIAKHRSVSPERLKSQVEGDLDWIVMKALEKDRNRRYESPSTLAHDIKNYLGDEPVEARPPTFRYRISKYLKRNRIAIIVAGVLVASLSLGLVGTAWQAQVAQRRLAEMLDELMAQTSIFALQGDLSAARSKLEAARELGADEGWCKLREGQIALQDGKYDEARALLQEARTLLPQSTAAYSLSLICEDFSGYEHNYLLEVGELKNWPVSGFEDYIYRGLAQTRAHPDRAVEDLENAISENSNHSVVHLLLASALRLLAADTPDPNEAYVIAKRATGEAFIAKEMLANNSFAIAEYVHAHIVLANACKELGSDYEHELKTCIDIARRAVDESKSYKPYDSMLHEARVYFFNQYGTRQQEASELFARVPDNLGSAEQHSDIVFRRAWMRFLDDDLESARQEFRSMDGRFAHRTNLTVPAFIDMTAATSKDLTDLREKYRQLLNDPERDRQGVFAHHDWAVARLLRLENVARQKGDLFYELATTLDHDYTDEFVPLARFMCGDDLPPEIGLEQPANSNRFLAETFFLLGVDRLASGKRDQAKQYFEKCLETRYYEYFVYWWSQAFLERIDDDRWLPWLTRE